MTCYTTGCIGVTSTSRECHIGDGSYSAWSDWTPCSASCDGGFSTRKQVFRLTCLCDITILFQLCFEQSHGRVVVETESPYDCLSCPIQSVNPLYHRIRCCEDLMKSRLSLLIKILFLIFRYIHVHWTTKSKSELCNEQPCCGKLGWEHLVGLFSYMQYGMVSTFICDKFYAVLSIFPKHIYITLYVLLQGCPKTYTS